MRKNRLLIIVIILLALGAGIIYYFTLQNNYDKLFGWKFPADKLPPAALLHPLVGVAGLEPGAELAYSTIRNPGSAPSGLPVRLKIPVIGVDTSIEDALITPDGRMDVPANAADVAWFSLGPQPGQIGSAVIGGHYGISNGLPWVFANLNKVKIGDKVYIVTDRGETIVFVVRRIESFDRNADATPVFVSTDGLAHLNLITCEGIWNKVNGTYPSRLVLFTDGIKSEGAAPATTLTKVDFPRKLSFGDFGNDVLLLQTALEQKGFLTIPPGITKGKFGALTRSAVGNYQKSAGLSPNGVFDSLTRDKLVADLASNSVPLNVGVKSFSSLLDAIKLSAGFITKGLIVLFIILILFLALKFLKNKNKIRLK